MLKERFHSIISNDSVLCFQNVYQLRLKTKHIMIRGAWDKFLLTEVSITKKNISSLNLPSAM